MTPAEQTISGWGNHPRANSHVYHPRRLCDLPPLMQAGADRTLVAHGLGRSYGDAATNCDAGVVDTTGLNRFISFDQTSGLLTAEAGVSYADLIEVLLPRGWFPKVTPGTKFVTLGGAIAADVHGKNHHKHGSFNRCVKSFTLLTPTGELLDCSPQEHADVFWSTLGGMGLTGLIQTVTIELRRVDSAWIDLTTTRVADLDAMLEHFALTDDETTYSVAWIDCLAGGAKLGRGVVLQGEHAGVETGSVGDFLRPSRRTKSVPFDMPGFVLHPLSVKAFNSFYYTTHRSGRSRIDIDRYFYPLDAVHHWNRIYGRRGFVQYQPVFPESDGGRGVRAVIDRLVQAKRSSFLAVLKRMGGQEMGPLSFPMKGLTLAVDIPRAHGIDGFLRELDKIVLDHGGRLYLAKDGSMSAETFAKMYPRLDEFRAVQRRLDPRGLMASDQARRLRIVEA